MFSTIASHRIKNIFYVAEVIELVGGQIFGLYKMVGS